MPKRHIVMLGKFVKRIAQLRGGGSALPGLFVERIDPHFAERTLGQLPQGVIVVSGTNGKTTTTKMVVKLLEGQGLKVFTNRTGSNFTRGVVAALLGDIDRHGRLDADIAVLELDEAYAVRFVETIHPRYTLLLNVMRDQLDRFGEIDTTAGMLAKVAQATTDTVVLNREDPRIARIANTLEIAATVYFGLSPTIRQFFPDDDNLRGAQGNDAPLPSADVLLSSFTGTTATFCVDGRDVTVSLRLTGAYNIYNAAAAMALVRSVCGESLDTARLYETLSTITPAFGRGESLMIDGAPCELVLVKNPAGFRLGLTSFDPASWVTMIAINDNYADGRDMSWLWDVEFESLRQSHVAVVSGTRAYDMALRLQYDEVAIGAITPDLKAALTKLISAHPNTPKRIYCTYTAMLILRKEIGKRTHLEEAIS